MTRGRSARSEVAGAEALSTYLLTGLTVLLAAGFAGAVFANLQVGASPPHASFTLSAAVGSRDVNLTHAGGEPLAFDALRFTARVNGTDVAIVSTSKSPPDADWVPGGVVTLTLSAPVPPDATVAVSVLHAERGLVASAARALGRAGTAADAVPTLAGATLSRGTTPADGATPVTVSVNATTPAGVLLVERVTVDLTPVGLTVTDLVDDGALGDATPLDGRFARAFTVPPGTLAGNYSLNLTATGAGGARASSVITLEVVNATISSGTSDGDKVLATKATTGTAFSGVPSSANVTKLVMGNVTWDHAAPNLLQNDILIMKITDPGHDSWTVLVLFAPVNGGLGLKELAIYSAQGGCSWSPQAYEITGPLDLLDPHTITGFGTGSGSSSMIPTGIPPGCDEVAPGVLRAGYENAKVDDPATLTILRLGENTGADEKTAVIHADVDYA